MRFEKGVKEDKRETRKEKRHETREKFKSEGRKKIEENGFFCFCRAKLANPARRETCGAERTPISPNARNEAMKGPERGREGWA
jgi:hypothetical protein